MLYALSWFSVAVLILLWSLTAWAITSIALWTVSNASLLTGAASGASAASLPDWLTPWVPPQVIDWTSQLIAGLGPFIDSLLQTAPALAGGLTTASWVIWGIGSALLVLMGFGLHLLIMFRQRRKSISFI